MSEESAITTPGIYPNLSFDQYAAIPAVNAGTLVSILKSPLHYQEALKEPSEEERKENEERFAVGSLAHSMVLEGKDLRSMFAIKPAGMSFATKDGKTWRDAQTLPIMKEENANSIPKMAEALAANVDTRDILRLSTDRELSLVAEIGGMLVKARFDALFKDLDGVPHIPDLKTSIDPTEEAFSKTIYNQHYDFKQDFYRRIHHAVYGVRPGFIWMAVEKRAPHAVCCWMPDEKVERSGHRKVERAMNLLLECRQTGKWPGPSTGLKTISLPRWANIE